MGPLCRVCNEAQSKYKCPSCLVPYCSLACFKRHKEVPCVKPIYPQKESNVLNAEPDLAVEMPLSVAEQSEVLLPSQLESIASSNEIRNALKDGSLQKLIYSIDHSPDPEKELEKTMEDEAFRIFTDKVLSSMGP